MAFWSFRGKIEMRRRIGRWWWRRRRRNNKNEEEEKEEAKIRPKRPKRPNLEGKQ